MKKVKTMRCEKKMMSKYLKRRPRQYLWLWEIWLLEPYKQALSFEQQCLITIIHDIQWLGGRPMS
jgi:hypothetical protein